MDKIATPVVLVVSAFLYFTHDAGFNFDRASPEKRVAFTERQAQEAVRRAQLVVRDEPRAVIVTGDAKQARVKVRSDGALMESRRRQDTFRQACAGYLASYLDGHDIALRLEFYDDRSRMTGVMSLTPKVCERTAAMAKAT
ncbi:hypothetical protein [Hyphomonas sp.]|uniref:hypothetical protein n=1 Tax=Hyphomonas sp. TaxID=87 RepID=UPI0025BB090A|nr:hypothetical protein [Hyphomonas sp.]MBI1398866.1 hypothetical protein [Hyphomonas sp.]